MADAQWFPFHKEVNKTTLMDIIEQTGLAKEEFLKLVK
jgi:hypothetical protein